MKPLIGITPSSSQDEMGHGTFYRYCLSRTYVDSVRAAGGIPIILPTDSADVAAMLDRIDGLLLSGGGDIAPDLYGDPTVHETTYGIDSDRDTFEIAAFQAAVERDLSTLCICRGIQTMAVAMGGTLIQDIPSDVPNAIEHRQHNLGKMRDDTSHDIRIESGNPLREAIGRSTTAVNSFHHQAVKDPGDGLEVVAVSSDGVIEGLWHPGMTFCIGVQWHPEMLAAHLPEQAAIFRSFIDSIRTGAAVS